VPASILIPEASIEAHPNFWKPTPENTLDPQFPVRGNYSQPPEYCPVMKICVRSGIECIELIELIKDINLTDRWPNIYTQSAEFNRAEE
jgi:hypothetical protein